MDYKKYIFPIDSTTDGSGVLVGNLFITAGHVIKMSVKPAVTIDGKSYTLGDALFLDTNEEKRSDGLDMAIFHLYDVKSPLKLSTEVSSIGNNLLSCSYRHVVIGDASTASTNIFCSAIKEDWVFEERIGTIINFYDNYFDCQFEESLSRGSSGSPILNGDKVYGILYGDKEGKNSSNTVLYLSSKVIVDLLENKN